MLSKIPYYGDKISYEYYAWVGNKILPVQTKSNYKLKYIKTNLKIHSITEKSLYIETKLHKFDYFPKSVLKFQEGYENIENDVWYNVEVALWFYKTRADIFGVI